MLEIYTIIMIFNLVMSYFMNENFSRYTLWYHSGKITLFHGRWNHNTNSVGI